MSSDWNPGIIFAEMTDIGLRRSNNQDSMACLPAKTQARFESHGHLLVVADGMGAHVAGELASGMATERIAMQYFRTADGSRREAIRQAVSDANDAIHQRGQSNPEFHNMGTTASALVIAPEGAIIAHAGDSRVYRLRDGTLEQLTFDHSLVWEMEASGQSSENYPKNVITRSLGPHAEVEVDVEGPFPVQVGDCFLVCSDGLTGLVEDTELGPLMACLPEDRLVRVLVDLANLRGGPDNITLLVARIKSLPEISSDRTPMGKKRSVGSTQITMLVTAIACFAAAGLMGIVGLRGPMVIAILLGVISSVIGWVQWMRSGPVLTESLGGKPTGSPYRRYDARPTIALHKQLGETVASLRKAAGINNWMMDWSTVDKLQSQGQAACDAKEIPKAIRFQADAIAETMNQLRELNDRASGETVIDR